MFDTHHRRGPTVAIVLAALAVVLLVAVGTVVALWVTGDSDDTPAAGGTDAGFTLDPVGTDPVDVATAVKSGVFTEQPAVQDSTWDALHTQAGHLTGPMAIAAAQAPSPAPKPISERPFASRHAEGMQGKNRRIQHRGVRQVLDLEIAKQQISTM